MKLIEVFIDDLLDNYRRYRRSDLVCDNFEKLRQAFHDYVVLEGRKVKFNDEQITKAVALIEREFLQSGIEKMFILNGKLRDLPGDIKPRFKGKWPSLEFKQREWEQAEAVERERELGI